MSRIVRRMLAPLALAAGSIVYATAPGCAPSPDDTIERRTGAVSSDTTNWLQFGGGPTHSGFNGTETTITRANVWKLRPAFTLSLPGGGNVSAPVIASSVSIPGQGVHDVAYYATDKGLLAAVDALSGAVLWTNESELRTSHPPGYGFIPSPVVDPLIEFVYMAEGDGKIHKYSVAGGAEIRTSPWPVAFTNKFKTNGVMIESAITSLTIGNGVESTGYLYVGSGGCDTGGAGQSCQGHVTTINLLSGARNVFNGMCSATGGLLTSCPQTLAGIWARGGVTFDPVTQRVYAVTGNGVWNPANHQWGETALAINANGTVPNPASGNPVDSFTPTDQASRNVADDDLGSTHMLVLPPISGSSFPHLGVVTGKGAKAYIVNLDNMSGSGGPGNLATVGETTFPPFTLPLTHHQIDRPNALWVNPADASVWVYVNSRGGMSALKIVVSGGKPAFTTGWFLPSGTTLSGGVVVANGVVYYYDGVMLHARDAATGAALWSWKQGDNANHTPVVVKGVLYFDKVAFTIANGTNLAGPGHSASQSSTINDGCCGGGPALGTDGDTNGAWTHGSVFHTKNDTVGPLSQAADPLSGGPWWFVDLGSARAVRQVVLFNRTDSCCMDRLAGYRINYWDSSSGGWRRASPDQPFATSSVNPIITVGVDFTSQWLMVEKTDGNWLHLAEVQVFGP